MEQDRKKLTVLSALSLTLQEFIDTSSESEDAELEIIQSLIQSSMVNIPRIEKDVHGIVATLTTQEFKAQFRMSPETCDYILSLIQTKLQRIKSGSPMISPRTQLLLTLWRLGTPDSFRSICERFDVGRSTALYVTRRVVKALVKLAPAVINWPTSERLNKVWAGFESINGFPKVIGVIDSMHINIPAPKLYPESYVNQKGHHSIQLQAICDHKCRFIHCYAGHVGSDHAQRVFRRSEIKDYLGNDTRFPQNSHLIGDMTYRLHANLLTPYRDNGDLTQRQNNYNYRHSSTRIIIERAFRLLKERFRSLSAKLAMNRVDLIPHYILACCVLHNMCLMRNDEIQFESNEAVDMLEANNIDNIDNIENMGNTGVVKRNLICEILPIRNV